GAFPAPTLATIGGTTRHGHEAARVSAHVYVPVIVAFVAALFATDARAQFTSTPVTTAEVGQPYVYNVAATGTGNVVITTPAGLPPWLTLVRVGNGTATLSGTPRPG